MLDCHYGELNRGTYNGHPGKDLFPKDEMIHLELSYYIMFII